MLTIADRIKMGAISVTMLLSSGLAAAASVPTASYSIGPGSDFDITQDAGKNTTRYYELIVGAYDAYTTFTLADTDADGKNVSYDLYLDNASGANSYDLIPQKRLINNLQLTDLVTIFDAPSFSYKLLANTEYVLVIKNANGANGPTLSATHISAVPLPAAVWLFGTALLGFVAVSNRRKV